MKLKKIKNFKTLNMVNFYVSIIIPTYNRANDLQRCLESLSNQSYKNFEVLVCDDGSTDNTEEIVKKFESGLAIQYIKDVNFGGPAKPRNNGINEAKGNVIAFLDSDDWWYPNKLEVSLSYLEEYDLVHHDLDIYVNLKESKGVARGRVLKGEILKDLIINGNGIVNSSVIVRKTIVDLVGEITEDKNLIAVEDNDYWIRISKITDKFKYINQSLGGYWVGDNISYSTKQIQREENLLNRYINLLSAEEQKKAYFKFYFNSARRLHYFRLFNEAKVSYLKSFKSKKIDLRIKSLIGYLFSCANIKI